MPSKILSWVSFRRYILYFCLSFIALVFIFSIPQVLPQTPYEVLVNRNSTLKTVAQKLEADKVIKSHYWMLFFAKLTGVDKNIQAGYYVFTRPTSLIGILKDLVLGQSQSLHLTLPEGITVSHMRAIMRQANHLQHGTEELTDQALLKKIGTSHQSLEGLFFPSTYAYEPQVSSLAIWQGAYILMQKKLKQAWKNRAHNLPYRNPYEMLIMASLIEKETAKIEDRTKIAAVFINRLKLNMRLQTDPSVKYGISPTFVGSLTRRALEKDTPYNTYTRYHLPPTPICLPSQASLEAAAHPAIGFKALYFVAKEKGESVFSESLKEHNAAVKKYILKISEQ